MAWQMIKSLPIPTRPHPRPDDQETQYPAHGTRRPGSCRAWLTAPAPTCWHVRLGSAPDFQACELLPIVEAFEADLTPPTR